MMGLITYGQNYLEFVENKGQWDKKILFLANTGIGSVALQADGYRVLLHNEQDLAKLNPHPHAHEHDVTTNTSSIKKSAVGDPSRGGDDGVGIKWRSYSQGTCLSGKNPEC